MLRPRARTAAGSEALSVVMLVAAAGLLESERVGQLDAGAAGKHR